jgi:hypothetical protein
VVGSDVTLRELMKLAPRYKVSLSEHPKELCQSASYHRDKTPEKINLKSRKVYLGSWFQRF